MASTDYLYRISLEGDAALASAQRFARGLQEALNQLQVRGSVDWGNWKTQFGAIERAAGQAGTDAGERMAKQMQAAQSQFMSKARGWGMEKIVPTQALAQAMQTPTKEIMGELKTLEGGFKEFHQNVSRMGVTPQEWVGASGMNRYMMSLQAAQRRVWGIRGMGAQAQMYGREMMGVGMAGLGGAAMAGKQYADFAEPMGRAARNLELNSQMTEELDVKLRQLAGTVSMFSPEEQASGLYLWAAATGEVVNSSADLNALLGRVGDVQKLAHLGMVDYGSAVEAVTDIQSQYQLHVSDTTDIVATLVKVAATSKAEVGDLAEAFKYAGTYANQTNTTFEETAAIFQLLSAYGQRGTMAGRGFARLMENLIAPSKQAQKALDALFQDAFGKTDVLVTAQGEFVGMAEAIRLMAVATEDLTQAERAEFVARITTQNAARVLLPLLSAEIEGRKRNIDVIEENEKILAGLSDTSTDVYVEMMQDVMGFTVSTKDSMQTFTDQWNQMLESTDGRLKMTQARVQGAMVSIGAAVMQTALPALESLAEVLSSIASYATAHPGGVQAFLGVSALAITMGALVTALGKGLTVYADAKAILMARTFTTATNQAMASFNAGVTRFEVAVGEFTVASGGQAAGAGAAGAGAAGAGAAAAGRTAAGTIAFLAARLLPVAAIIYSLDKAQGEAAESAQSYRERLRALTHQMTLTEEQVGALTKRGLQRDPKSGEWYAGADAPEPYVAGQQLKPEEVHHELQKAGAWSEMVFKWTSRTEEAWRGITGYVQQAGAFMPWAGVGDEQSRPATRGEMSQMPADSFDEAINNIRLWQDAADSAAGTEIIDPQQVQMLRELAEVLGLDANALGIFVRYLGEATYALEGFSGGPIQSALAMLNQFRQGIPTGGELAGQMGGLSKGAWGKAQGLLDIGWSSDKIIGEYDKYLVGLAKVMTEAESMTREAGELHILTYQNAFSQMVQGHSDAHKDMQKAAEQSIKNQQRMYEQAENGLRGFVERALSPTSVTEEDVAATEEGTYKDKWDEEVRRMKAAMAGSKEWRNMIPESVWAQGEQAAQAYGQNWINQFYSGMHPEAIRWGPLLDSIENALAMEAGKKDLVNTVMTRLAEERGITATSDQVLAALGLTGILPGGSVAGLLGPEVAGGMADATPEAMAEQAKGIVEGMLGPVQEQMQQADMSSMAAVWATTMGTAIKEQMGTVKWSEQFYTTIRDDIKKNEGELLKAGKLIGGALWDGIYMAFEDSNLVYIIAHKVLELLTESGPE